MGGIIVGAPSPQIIVYSGNTPEATRQAALAAASANAAAISAATALAASTGREFVAQITGSVLAASEVLFSLLPPTGKTWTFAGNLAGAAGIKLPGGTNPLASYAIDVQKNGASVGTITISTGGAVSFVTAGGAAVVLTGGADVLQAIGPATPDPGALGYVITLIATVS